jgi:ABC-type glutathione transport system ATPase component
MSIGRAPDRRILEIRIDGRWSRYIAKSLSNLWLFRRELHRRREGGTRERERERERERVLDKTIGTLLSNGGILHITPRPRRMANLEEVFRLSGVPTYTFVQPDRYDEIKVSVRTPGRCLVLEGPSGIGKTTTVTKVLADLGMSEHVIPLSARKQSDLEYIGELPNLGKLGTVIVDDFHRLDDAVKSRLSDFMKILADSEDPHPSSS